MLYFELGVDLLERLVQQIDALLVFNYNVLERLKFLPVKFLQALDVLIVSKD